MKLSWLLQVTEKRVLHKLCILSVKMAYQIKIKTVETWKHNIFLVDGSEIWQGFKLTRKIFSYQFLMQTLHLFNVSRSQKVTISYMYTTKNANTCTKTQLPTYLSSDDIFSFGRQPVFTCTSQYIIYQRAIRHIFLFEYTCRSYVQVNEIFCPWKLQNEYMIENPLRKENSNQNWVLVQTSSLFTQYIYFLGSFLNLQVFA